VNVVNQREKAEASGGKTAAKNVPTQKKGFGVTNGQQVLLSVKICDMRQITTELKRTKWRDIVRYEQER